MAFPSGSAIMTWSSFFMISQFCDWSPANAAKPSLACSRYLGLSAARRPRRPISRMT
jgi:hypothetical protein